jgi:hypothetical protein
MMSSSRANDKAVQCLDKWQERAKLDCDELNFFEIEFDSVIVKVEIFKIVDSLSGADLFFNILLNRGNMCEPKVIGAAE